MLLCEQGLTTKRALIPNRRAQNRLSVSLFFYFKNPNPATKESTHLTCTCTLAVGTFLCCRVYMKAMAWPDMIELPLLFYKPYRDKNHRVSIKHHWYLVFFLCASILLWKCRKSILSHQKDEHELQIDVHFISGRTNAATTYIVYESKLKKWGREILCLRTHY